MLTFKSPKGLWASLKERSSNITEEELIENYALILTDVCNRHKSHDEFMDFIKDLLSTINEIQNTDKNSWNKVRAKFWIGGLGGPISISEKFKQNMIVMYEDITTENKLLQGERIEERFVSAHMALFGQGRFMSDALNAHEINAAQEKCMYLVQAIKDKSHAHAVKNMEGLYKCHELILASSWSVTNPGHSSSVHKYMIEKIKTAHNLFLESAAKYAPSYKKGRMIGEAIEMIDDSENVINCYAPNVEDLEANGNELILKLIESRKFSAVLSLLKRGVKLNIENENYTSVSDINGKSDLENQIDAQIALYRKDREVSLVREIKSEIERRTLINSLNLPVIEKPKTFAL